MRLKSWVRPAAVFPRSGQFWEVFGKGDAAIVLSTVNDSLGYTCGACHAESRASERWKACGHIRSISRPGTHVGIGAKAKQRGINSMSTCSELAIITPVAEKPRGARLGAIAIILHFLPVTH